MNIRELNAGLRAFGSLNTTLFGSTIMVYGHTVVIHESGKVMVDYNEVGKVTDSPLDLIDNIKAATL